MSFPCPRAEAGVARAAEAAKEVVWVPPLEGGKGEKETWGEKEARGKHKGRSVSSVRISHINALKVI